MKALYFLCFWLLIHLCNAQTLNKDLLVAIHEVTTSEMQSLAAETGALVFNSDDESIYVFNGSIWENHISNGSETYLVSGTNITITGIGTTEDPYVIATKKATITANTDGSYTFSNSIDADVTFTENTSPPPTGVVVPDSNLSFALSLRKLYEEYNGPLLRLRRASDNAEEDFYAVSTTDLVDVNAINTWRSGSLVYMVKWYDQSNQSRDAVERTASNQPQFISDVNLPYFVGDGSGDKLTVETSIQTLTNRGANGTVLTVAAASSGANYSFGVLSGSNRWSGHLNWGNYLYFDPGRCCNNPRNVLNSSNINILKQYTFLRGDASVLVRIQGAFGYGGNFNIGRTTVNSYFGILVSTGTSRTSKHKFTEMIMYKTDISSAHYKALEQDQISYWGL